MQYLKNNLRPEPNPEEEEEYLQNELSYLQDQVGRINKRLENIRSEREEKKG